MRRGCSPCLIDNSGQHIPLTQIPFSEKRIAETFLQEAIHSAPEILPIDEIDRSYAPVVSLGREIDNIDNLLISPTGRLTIVETKLWRNPEATREVVAQILDYATRISRWSYTDLEKQVRHAMAPAPIGDQSLYDYVVSASADDCPSEEEFVDSVTKGLTSGRSMLLVVGDGIRENVQTMLGALHRHPQMLFTFALVELRIYESLQMQGKKLVVPQVVANSSEVVRAVVRVQTTGQATVSVELEDADDETNPRPGRKTLSEQEFFDAIQDQNTKTLYKQILAFSMDVGAVPNWRAVSVSIQLPDPAGSKQNLTLFVMTTSGKIYTGWLPAQLEKISLSPEIAHSFVKRIAMMFANIEQHPTMPDSLSRNLTASEIQPRVDDFCDLIRETVQQIKQEKVSSEPDGGDVQ